MSYLLTTLTKKKEIDTIIRDTIDKVLVLRFGRATDALCLQLDDIVLSLPLFYLCLSSSFFFFFGFPNGIVYSITNKIIITIDYYLQLAKSSRDVSKFADVALVDIDSEDVQVYVKYFDITLIPSTVFFFNAHHMKMDSGWVFMLSSFTFPLL